MKKFFALMSLVLGAIAFTGCNTSNIEESPIKEGNFSFTVKMDPMTRATVEKNNVVFNVGDKVAFGAAEHATTDTVTKAMIAEYSNNDGMFYCDTVLDGTKSYDFYALWPYQAGPKGASFNLPAKLKNPNQYSTYIYVGKQAFNQIAQNIDSAMQYAPMIGANTVGSPAAGASVTLHHVASMLEFYVKNATTAPVKFHSLKMTVGDGTKFCGTYYVDMTTGELSPSGANYVYDNCTVTIEGDSDEYQPGTGHRFFMPIAPVTLAAGTEITFDITASDGTLCRVVKHIPATASVTFEAGKWNTQDIDYTGASTITHQTLAQVLEENASLANNEESTSSYDVVNATVYAQNRSNVIVYDGTAYMLVYKKAADTVTNGDIISISGKVKNYYGILEFNGPEITKTGSTTLDFDEPTVQFDATQYAAFASHPYVDYIKVVGTFSKDGSNIFVTTTGGEKYEIYPDAGHSFDNLVEGTSYRFFGFTYGYHSTRKTVQMIINFAGTDFDSATMELNPTSLTFEADATGSANMQRVSVTYTNTTVQRATTEADWLTVQWSASASAVNVTVNNANTGAARTATVTVEAIGISKTFTVTQKASATGVTIASILADGAGDYALSGVTVYAFNTYTPSGGTATLNNVIVGDATGFMLVYRPVLTTASQGLEIGSVVDISGPVILYENTNSGNKIMEFSGSTDNPVNISITGSSTPVYPNPVTFSHSQFTSYFSGVATVQYVAVSGTYTSAGVTNSDNDIYYTSNSSGVSFSGLTNKPVNCKGFVYGFSNTSGKISYLVTDVAEDTTAPTLELKDDAGATVTSLSFEAAANNSNFQKLIYPVANNTTVSGVSSSQTWLTATLMTSETASYIAVYPNAANTTVNSRTATVTVSTAAGVSKTVDVTQYGVSSGTAKFVKVTSASALTDGDYLIVYETGKVAFNGGLSTLDAVSNTISVTISNNEIAANDATNAAIFTYNSTDKTLKSKSGYYIGRTSDKNGLDSDTGTKYTNTITISSGDADIVSSSAHLRFNANADQLRFRYYQSSSYSKQKAIQLYKKTN